MVVYLLERLSLSTWEIKQAAFSKSFSSSAIVFRPFWHAALHSSSACNTMGIPIYRDGGAHLLCALYPGAQRVVQLL